jgi:cation-transporting ATPase E
MIGDGVNDVLSLKKSNLAVAMASGSQATRSVADIVLTDDSFAALAPAVQEGQRIINGMFDILSLFLARISTMGLIILSSLVIGQFPIPLRPASAITLFSVGIPAAMLAIWAQPGPQIRDSLGGRLLRFVLPAAIFSSVLGLTMFYGVLLLQMASYGDLASMTPAQWPTSCACLCPSRSRRSLPSSCSLAWASSCTSNHPSNGWPSSRRRALTAARPCSP